jgi:hypothetical protein
MHNQGSSCGLGDRRYLRASVISRRQFLAGSTVLWTASRAAFDSLFGDSKSDGRLRSRPGEKNGETRIGLHTLGIAEGRDGLLFVPEQLDVRRPATLMIMLHGAGGSGRASIHGMRSLAEELKFVLLAPDSRATTWDIATGKFGEGVDFIDRSLAETFRQVQIDPQRINIAGFSDGASPPLRFSRETCQTSSRWRKKPRCARRRRLRKRPRVLFSRY